MAETVWQSSGDNDWGTAANWSNGVPGTNATAIFNGTSQVSVAGSDESAGGTLTRIRIDRAYRGHIGTSGSPLKIPAKFIDHHGSGAIYIYSTLYDVYYPRLSLNSLRPTDLTAFSYTGYNAHRFDVVSGNMLYQPSASNLGENTVPVIGSIQSGKLTTQNGALNLQVLNIRGGSVDIYGKVGACLIAHGVVRIYADRTGGDEITDLFQYTGDTTLEADPFTTSGQQSSVIIMGGTFNASKLSSVQSNAFVTIFPGAAFLATPEIQSQWSIRDLRLLYPEN